MASKKVKDRGELKDYSLRRKGIMSTAVETPVTNTESVTPTSSSAAVTYSTEAELDEALAAEQQRLNQLAEQQRFRNKRKDLERLRAECSRLQILDDQPCSSSVPSFSITSSSATQVSSVISSVMSTHVTSNSLRNMRHVQDSVDELMRSNGLAVKDKKSSEKSRRRQHVESSSGSDDTDTDSSSDESSKKRSKSKSKRRHKSGKSKKLTSNVPFPQRWPETYLKLHYVGKQKDHESLSIAEFCAGFTTIIQRTKCTIEKEARIDLLRDLMYFATIYPWSNVLAFHGACIMEIEQGILKWGSDFHHLIHTTLLMPSRSSSRSTTGRTGRGGASSTGGASSGGGAVRFCPKYQRNQCTFDRDHDGMFRNQNCHLRHICAKCWLENKSFAAHPESSSTCPLSVTSAPATSADAVTEG